MSAPKQMPSAEDATESWRVLLQQAAVEVLSTMVGVEPTVPEQIEPEPGEQVTGMVGMAGALCGLLSVHCSAKVATEIASRMLGLGEEEAVNHWVDAVGEVCNMVAGAFKAKIPGLEDQCMLSVPTVITGDSYATQSLIVGQRTAVHLLFQGEPLVFTLETNS
jgi:chemotaxis protein CheX